MTKFASGDLAALSKRIADNKLITPADFEAAMTSVKHSGPDYATMVTILTGKMAPKHRYDAVMSAYHARETRDVACEISLLELAHAAIVHLPANRRKDAAATVAKFAPFGTELRDQLNGLAPQQTSNGMSPHQFIMAVLGHVNAPALRHA